MLFHKVSILAPFEDADKFEPQACLLYAVYSSVTTVYCPLYVPCTLTGPPLHKLQQVYYNNI